MGRVVPPGTSRECARLSLRISTRAATVMEIVEITCPTPILCNMVNPRSSPVIRRANGTKNLSYKGKKTHIVRVTNRGMEAAGIWKWDPSCLFNVVPWFRNRVPTWANTAENIKLVTQMGSIRTSNFTSSTCVTVHSLQGLGFITSSNRNTRSCSTVGKAALSRNLQISQVSNWAQACQPHDSVDYM